MVKESELPATEPRCVIVCDTEVTGVCFFLSLSICVSCLSVSVSLPLCFSPCVSPCVCQCEHSVVPAPTFLYVCR